MLSCVVLLLRGSPRCLVFACMWARDHAACCCYYCVHAGVCHYTFQKYVAAWVIVPPAGGTAAVCVHADA
jgi:hypothetical protein